MQFGWVRSLHTLGTQQQVAQVTESGHWVLSTQKQVDQHDQVTNYLKQVDQVIEYSENGGSGHLSTVEKWVGLLVGWQPPKKRLIKEVRIHHKKDGFFLHNIFVWCLKVQKSNVVLTDYCQIYGLPLTSHVISGQNREVQILAKITWDVNGSP